MSARWRAPAPEAPRLVPMTTARLDAVMAIEHAAYPVPWTRGNFVDSLVGGYFAQCLLDAGGVMLGYCVAMQGAGEMHLLNLTVAPAWQGRGHARHMLDTLAEGCRQRGIMQLWLEVREGNARARRMYDRYGLVEVGIRKAYYPAAAGGTSAGREDAVVMSLHFGAAT